MQQSPDSSNANFTASAFFLLESLATCRHCGARTRVFALALPAAHRWLQTDDDDECAEAWRTAARSAVLFHVQSLNGAAALQLRDLAPGYHPQQDSPSGNCGWTNHCDRCDLPLEEDELHCEPEAAFLPVSSQAARMIRLTEVRQGLEVWATDCAPDASWLAHVTRG